MSYTRSPAMLEPPSLRKGIYGAGHARATLTSRGRRPENTELVSDSSDSCYLETQAHLGVCWQGPPTLRLRTVQCPLGEVISEVGHCAGTPGRRGRAFASVHFSVSFARPISGTRSTDSLCRSPDPAARAGTGLAAPLQPGTCVVFCQLSALLWKGGKKLFGASFFWGGV